MAARMTVQEKVQRRTKSRVRVLMTGTLVAAGGSHNVLVRDVSRHGAQIYADNKIMEGQDVCFRRGPIFVAARVAWCKKGVAGLEFYRKLATSELDKAFHPVIEPSSAG